MASSNTGKAAIVLGAILAYVLMSKKSAGAGPKMVTVKAEAPRGQKVARKATWPGDTKSWARTRFQAARTYLTSQGITDKVDDIALSAVALWSLETAGGKAEWNYNVGNIHPVGSQSYTTNGENLRAFDSLEAGVRAFFELLKAGYSGAWEWMQASPEQAGWVKALKTGEAGAYYGADPETYAASWATIRGNLAQYAEQ